MKRRDVIKYLEEHRCTLEREGAKHSVFKNVITGATSTLPRHSEVDDFLVKKICKDLMIKNPWRY